MAFLKDKIIANSALFVSLNSTEKRQSKSDITFKRIYNLENKYRGESIHYLDSDVIKVIQSFGQSIDQEVISYWKKIVKTKTLTCSMQ